MTTYGIRIEMRLFDDLTQFCENNHLEYQLWNFLEVMNGTAEFAQIEFDDQDEYRQAKEFLTIMKRT